MMTIGLTTSVMRGRLCMLTACLAHNLKFEARLTGAVTPIAAALVVTLSGLPLLSILTLTLTFQTSALRRLTNMHIISFTNLDGFLFTHSFETLNSAVKFIECLALLCLPFHHYFEE